MLHINGNGLAQRQKAQLFLPSSCQKCLLDLVATFGQVRPALIMDGNDGSIPEQGCEPCSFRCSERDGDGAEPFGLGCAEVKQGYCDLETPGDFFQPLEEQSVS
jgi:hypothetical protein